MSRYRLSNSSPFGFGPEMSTGCYPPRKEISSSNCRREEKRGKEVFCYHFIEFTFDSRSGRNFDGELFNHWHNDLAVLAREPSVWDVGHERIVS